MSLVNTIDSIFEQYDYLDFSNAESINLFMNLFLGNAENLGFTTSGGIDPLFYCYQTNSSNPVFFSVTHRLNLGYFNAYSLYRGIKLGQYNTNYPTFDDLFVYIIEHFTDFSLNVQKQMRKLFENLTVYALNPLAILEISNLDLYLQFIEFEKERILENFNDKLLYADTNNMFFQEALDEVSFLAQFPNLSLPKFDFFETNYSAGIFFDVHKYILVPTETSKLRAIISVNINP